MPSMMSPFCSPCLTMALIVLGFRAGSRLILPAWIMVVSLRMKKASTPMKRVRPLSWSAGTLLPFSSSDSKIQVPWSFWSSCWAASSRADGCFGCAGACASSRPASVRANSMIGAPERRGLIGGKVGYDAAGDAVADVRPSRPDARSASGLARLRARLVEWRLFLYDRGFSRYRDFLRVRIIQLERVVFAFE